MRIHQILLLLVTLSTAHAFSTVSQNSVKASSSLTSLQQQSQSADNDNRNGLQPQPRRLRKRDRLYNSIRRCRKGLSRKSKSFLGAAAMAVALWRGPQNQPAMAAPKTTQQSTASATAIQTKTVESLQAVKTAVQEHKVGTAIVLGSGATVLVATTRSRTDKKDHGDDVDNSDETSILEATLVEPTDAALEEEDNGVSAGEESMSEEDETNPEADSVVLNLIQKLDESKPKLGADSAWFKMLDSASNNPEVTFGALASTAAFFISHNVPWSVVAFGTVFSLFQDDAAGATATATATASGVNSIEEAVETTASTEELEAELAKREDAILKQELEVLRLELLDRLEAEERAAAAVTMASPEAKAPPKKQERKSGYFAADDETSGTVSLVPEGWTKEKTKATDHSTATPDKKEEVIATVVNGNTQQEQEAEEEVQEPLEQAIAVKAKLQPRVKIESQRLSKKEIALQEKYAAIESVEDRAYQILKDLGMVGKK